MFAFLALFITSVFSLGQDVPASYYCKPFTISEARWAREYPGMYAFHGLLAMQGDFYFPNAALEYQKFGAISGYWYQYFDSEGTLWGETWMRDLPGAPPGVLFRTAKNTLVPIPNSNRVCQVFTPDSPPEYLFAYPYSEVNPVGVGHSNSAYYYTRPDMLGRVGSAEIFSWDLEFQSAFAVVTSITQGNGHAEHHLGFIGYFRYDKIHDPLEAVRLGFTSASAPVFNTTHRVPAGLAHIPIEWFPEQARPHVRM